ncbi:MAG: helix-turn-helix transcriptional regulator [Treponema sp.]|nr:helix-turn-helix transcriptional regulator [Treponema sp.]
MSLGKPGTNGELIIDGGYLNNPPISAHAPLVAVSGADSKLIMYDGVILQNNYNIGEPPSISIYQNGGGFSIGSKGSIKKTGGIIYGANAPRGYSNNSLEGMGSPRVYGHAGIVHLVSRPLFQYRNDTVRENDNLYYIGSPDTNGVFGEGDKWDSLDDVIFRRRMIVVILFIAAILFGAVIVFYVKKHRKQPPVSDSIEIDMSLFTIHEKKVLDLLFTDQSTKMIANTLNLTNRGVAFHCNKIYCKLKVQSRTELLVKYKMIYVQKKQLSAMTEIKSTIEPGVDLTPREKEVFNLLLSGYTAKQITQALQLSVSSVNFHSQNVYRKLGIQSRTELLIKFKKT